MAVLKQRLHRKNASGSYDTIWLETSSDLVKMSDGSTTLTSKISSMDSSISQAVKKTGDTMTGNLFIENTTPSLELQNSGNSRIGYVAMSPDSTFGFYNYLDPDNRQGLYITQEANALFNAIRFLRTVDGVTNYYSLYGQHNITAGTTDLTAGSSALITGSIYLVYE